MHVFTIIVLLGLAIVVGLAVFIGIVGHNMHVVAKVTAKDETLKTKTGLSWFLEKLAGWKTHILAWITAISGAIAAVPTDIIQGWAGLPWTQVFDQKIAAWVAIVCGLLASITHSQGLKRVAETPPVEPPS